VSPKFSLGRTERLTVRITPESAARLAHAAESRRVSQTDVLEQLLMSLPQPEPRAEERTEREEAPLAP
jgi:Ribbon-helix-helix protein, copG family